MVICEILGVECGVFGIGCILGGLVAENMVDFGVRENWEMFGKWVRKKEIDQKVRFALIVGAR